MPLAWLPAGRAADAAGHVPKALGWPPHHPDFTSTLPGLQSCGIWAHCWVTTNARQFATGTGSHPI